MPVLACESSRRLKNLFFRKGFKSLSVRKPLKQKTDSALLSVIPRVFVRDTTPKMSAIPRVFPQVSVIPRVFRCRGIADTLSSTA